MRAVSWGTVPCIDLEGIHTLTYFLLTEHVEPQNAETGRRGNAPSKHPPSLQTSFRNGNPLKWSFVGFLLSPPVRHLYGPLLRRLTAPRLPTQICLQHDNHDFSSHVLPCSLPLIPIHRIFVCSCVCQPRDSTPYSTVSKCYALGSGGESV
ncbi:hypothetical protein OH77DRAFT_622836 [Trametes cingulata]|nr:hypothetical protein OH77DRAFT_622836 [Trametes cingulata]